LRKRGNLMEHAKARRRAHAKMPSRKFLLRLGRGHLLSLFELIIL